MSKDELVSMLNSIQHDDSDMRFKLLEFLINNCNSNTSKYGDKLRDSGELRSFFNVNEYIKTNGSEVPKEGGGWWYNGTSTYNFFYILIEDSNLLVLEAEDCNDDDTDFIPTITFRLHPIKDDYMIKTTPGHRKGPYNEPYLSIVDSNGNNAMASNGNPITTFYFEYIVYNFDRKNQDINGKLLKDVLPSLSINELIERYQREVNESIENMKKCLALRSHVR